jgi:hypothetical protein
MPYGQNVNRLFALDDLIDDAVDMGFAAVKQVPQLRPGSGCFRRDRATPGKDLKTVNRFFKTIEPGPLKQRDAAADSVALICA